MLIQDINTKRADVVVPKLVLLVMYKTEEGVWRGFCNPYDVSCEAETKGEVVKKLQNLVELYEEGLRKYNYPKHLSVKALSDSRDKLVLKIALEEIAKDIQAKIKKDLDKFQTETKSTFRAGDKVKLSGYYYQPQPTLVAA